MNRFAQTAVRLFGIFWLVRGFASCAGSSADFFRFQPVHGSSDWFSFMMMSGAAAAVVLVFSIIPAILLIAFSERLADRLFPDASSEPTFDSATALVVGSILLSFFFMIEGGASLIAGLVTSAWVLFGDSGAAKSYSEYGHVSICAVGAAELLLGFLLYRHACERADALSGR